jgi:hypothetical protein
MLVQRAAQSVLRSGCTETGTYDAHGKQLLEDRCSPDCCPIIVEGRPCMFGGASPHEYFSGMITTAALYGSTVQHLLEACG